MDDLPDLMALSTYDAGLRQVPADAAALEGALARAEGLLAAARAGGDRVAVRRLLGYVGEACRVLGRGDAAVRAGREALALAEGDGPRAGFAARVRLAEALRYRGPADWPEAEGLYRAALVLAADPALADLEDFALQHLGKCRLDQGDAAEAVACFERALALRRAKGDPVLVASTEEAIRAVSRRLSAIRSTGESSADGR